MKSFLRLLTCFILFTLLACRHENNSNKRLTVYAAASMSDAISEIAQQYSKNNDIEFIFNFASSGALSQQIAAAPRADIFFSASEKWVDRLAKKDLIKFSQNICSNQLVIVTHKESPIEFTEPQSFPFLPFSHLCIGDPQYVPAGRYAMEWLSSIDSSAGGTVWEQVKSKISPTPDVRSAVIQTMGSSDNVGIVYSTDFAHHSENLKLLYQVPLNEGPQISYIAAKLKNSKKDPLVDEFFYFLNSEESKEILNKHGFFTVEK